MDIYEKYVGSALELAKASVYLPRETVGRRAIE